MANSAAQLLYGPVLVILSSDRILVHEIAAAGYIGRPVTVAQQ